MAATTTWYRTPVKNQYDGTAVVNFLSDTIKQSLHTSTYSPNPDTHDFFDDVTNEVSSANYTAGGATLGSKTVTVDGATDEIRFDAADPSWTNVTFTARYGVVYKSTGTASTSPLMFLIDFGADQTVSGSNFSIQYDTTGIAKADAT